MQHRLFAQFLKDDADNKLGQSSRTLGMQSTAETARLGEGEDEEERRSIINRISEESR